MSEPAGETLWQLSMFSVGDFPVSRTPKRADAGEAPTNGTCGPSSPDSLPNSGRDGLLSRTSPASCPLPMPDMTDAAYAAGLVDGEGCLMLAKDLQPILFVGMTIKAKAVLDQMAHRWGGMVGHRRKATVKWEASCMWRLSAAETLEPFLVAIQPFLRLKTEQARLLLRVFELKRECPHRSDGRAVFNDQMRERLNTIRLTIQHLNRKGPTQPMPLTALAQLVAGQWVTNQRDFLSETGLEPFSETWPRAGMTRNGIAYQLAPSAPLTDAIGSGSWPTPTRNDGLNAGYQKGQGDRVFLTLPGAVGSAPIPPGKLVSGAGSQMWPTPGAAEGFNRRRALPAKKRNDGLETAARMWPTPTTQDASNNGGSSQYERNSLPLNAAVGGALNPTWVEWLMGYPLGWTA